MSSCPKCEQYLCDAGTYYCHPKGKNSTGYTPKKQLIKCPVCGHIGTFENFKTIYNDQQEEKNK